MTSLKQITPNDAIEQFDAILRENAPKKVGDPREIMEQVRYAKSITPQAYDDKAIAQFLKSRAKTLQDLCQQLLIAKITALYGLVDPSLFNLKRHFIVKNNKVFKDQRRKSSGRKDAGEIRFEFPLFIYSNIDEATVQLDKQTTTHGDEWDRIRRHHELSVDVPEIPDEIKKEIPKATGAYYRILGDILMDADLSELNLQEGFYEPSFGVTWIPKASSFNYTATDEIIEKEPVLYDPALLMSINNDSFLVRTWDIKEEEPYDHFLREFTEGAYPKKN
jgi:hypothetical protein